MKPYVHLTVVFSFITIINYVSAKGCVQLDSFSFDKVASKFKATLVKFDAAYPYGPKQEEYEKVCEASSNVDDLLVVEVAVKDYGEKENTDLAKKYGAEKDDYPVVKLFVQGKPEPSDFVKTEDFTADNLKKFIRSKSGVYIGCTGCLKDFDEIAAKFSTENNAEEKKKLLRRAEDLWDNAKGNQEQKYAEVYVKIMRKVIEKGDEFLNSEHARVDNLLKGKVSKEKKEELQHRLNILQGFKTALHDEL
ncbi:endoplasmic reticulum resident protein 29-like [Macrosteles quadrilineatus]|uniref:endoplasmic reticulum resident protein 29-like n=1 Tax=Macrosteles quadrilineatus TaxID=74068 RepID=UPI0023E1F91C|nr:endoplasmic reticulum resident protein 29-like [Macrosteles quadrilineatus]